MFSHSSKHHQHGFSAKSLMRPTGFKEHLTACIAFCSDAHTLCRQCLDRPRHGPAHEHCTTEGRCSAQKYKESGRAPCLPAMPFDWPSFLRVGSLPSSLPLPCSRASRLAGHERKPDKHATRPGARATTWPHICGIFSMEASPRGTRAFSQANADIRTDQ